MGHWAEMSAPELRRAADGGAVAVWPIGATEQHGGHLATGFDLVAAEAVCREAERRAGDVVVLLPGMPFGASEHWLPLGATLSLRPTTLVTVLEDVIRSTAEADFRRLLVVNGHHGNRGPLLTALGSPRDGMRVEAVSYWDLLDPDELRRRCRADDGGIGHAGEVETSIALHLGGLVRAEPAAGSSIGAGPGSRDQRLLSAPSADEIAGGVLGDPRQADAALGAWIVDTAAAALAVEVGVRT